MAARRILRRAAQAAASAMLLAGAAAFAAPAASPGAGAPLAARIDGEPLYALTVDTLWQQRRAGKSTLERRAMLDELISQRLLAARTEATAPPEPAGTPVAFAADVVVEDRLAGALRDVYGKDLDAAVAALPGGTLDSVITAQAPIPQAQLDAIFGSQGPLLLEIALTPAQQAQAGKIEVLRYRFPCSEERSISLYDVYHRQNVQGRLALTQQPAKVAEQQARRILADAFIQHWARQRFGAEAVADLRRAIADGETVAALQRLHGVGLDTDSGSPLLNRLASEASPAEIEVFYRQHKDLFARIEKVRARHIRLADEAQAQRALNALQGGASFAATASSMSRARDATKGGDLGWISADGRKDWLASLAFSQEPGKASMPVRAPVGPNDPAYWEIVLVEERVQGAHPLESETVRYQASRMIAAKKAVQRLNDMADQARKAARIDIVEVQ
ncbi:peptidylprolyl isomerase [Pseudoduganella violaceinigra]|uniref:peptidylprolyl isomerase n=1 Tax=Pseudoduganella violaceinigra TaxID=246602 RepID=UPI0004093D41|nr:peptidylprolyl isomerase [Pseudoduganella violaceinigra]